MYQEQLSHSHRKNHQKCISMNKYKELKEDKKETIFIFVFVFLTILNCFINIKELFNRNLLEQASIIPKTVIMQVIHKGHIFPCKLNLC